MAADKRDLNVMTPIFRVSFPQVFKAKYDTLAKKERFSIQALYKKGEDLTVLKKAAHLACQMKFGEDPAKWPKGLKSPFRDQADRAKDGKLPEGHEEGAIFMTYNSDSQPPIRDAANLKYITEPSKFYPGCWARASVYANAYDVNGGKGVSFLLNGLQFAKDGESFSSRPNVEDAFAPIEGSETGGDATTIF